MPPERLIVWLPARRIPQREGCAAAIVIAAIHTVQNESKYFFMVKRCYRFAFPAEYRLFNHRRTAGRFRCTTLAKYYPTLPSKLTDSSFCASTANSMGSLLSTSLA